MNDVWPFVLLVTNVRIGAFVSKRACDVCQISTLVPWSAFANGYGIAQNFDENSSFERPVTYSLPSTSAMRVIDCERLLRPVVDAAGGFGSVTLVNFAWSSEATSTLPAPSTRTSAGCAAAPCAAHDRDVGVVRRRVHGDVANRDLRGVGADERGDLLIERRHVHRCRPRRRDGAEIEREDRGGRGSAANSVPSAPNASVPMEVSDGPTDGLAESETDVVAAASASTRANLHRVLVIGGYLEHGSGVLLALRCALQWAAHRGTSEPRNFGTTRLFRARSPQSRRRCTARQSSGGSGPRACCGPV